MAIKKVAIIIERADTALGGAERSVFELADALREFGLEVDILAGSAPESFQQRVASEPNAIHYMLNVTPGTRVCYFTFAKALKKWLTQNHYDIVHSVLPFDFVDIYQPRGGSFTEAILRNAASYQNKFIRSYKRATAFANIRRTILAQAERKLCKQSNGPIVVALSEYVKRCFKQHYGLDDKRIVVIPNGIKIQHQIDTQKADKLRSQILSQLGLKEANQSVFFLFVANNFRLKGLAVLIKALQLAVNKFAGRPQEGNSATNAYLIVTGRDKPYKYQKLAKRLNLDRRIVFLGYVPGITSLLSISDVAVLPTFYDPCSRFILEAIAAHKPVITTKFNGATDLFVNYRHGRVIDCPEDIYALAEAIRYFSDTNNIQKASQAIIEDNLKEKISIHRVAKQLISVYNTGGKN